MLIRRIHEQESGVFFTESGVKPLPLGMGI